MSAEELVALIDGRPVGRVIHDRRGRLSFHYEQSWLRAHAAYPISLSMPLGATPHGHSLIEAFLWGLLPDNATILERWSSRFGVSPRNAFALIAHVGEDCAGAVQFVRPERIETLQKAHSTDIEWLNAEQIAERLRLLRSDHAAWRMQRDTGQFSLAGAQPKTAFLFDNGRWGIPSGRTPTTHILKPPAGHLDGFIENEHFCLQLVRALGLPTADSQVMRFADEIAIVVERFDRIRDDRDWTRIHQEDMCQALGKPPAKKYQNDGGPGARDIVELLRSYSRQPGEDAATFVKAIAANWLIGNTDAHAKNYGILIGGGGQVRLAPLYDVASVLPYPQFDVNRVKLAMKVADQYRLRDIGRRQWEKAADQLRMDSAALIGQIIQMAQALPDLATTIARKAASDGLTHPVIERLTKCLIGRSLLCLSRLGAGTYARTE